MPGCLRVLALGAICFCLVTCGGGSGGGGDPGYGTFPVPDGPGGTPPPGGGGGGGTTPPPALAGGVLATFDVSGETFSMWVPASSVAQALVDAWTGAAPPIPAVCADVQLGSGVGNHNAPWSWSVNPNISILLNGICVGCAFAWNTPSAAEAGITNGPPYDCDDYHSGGTRATIMMQVTMIDLKDYR